MTSLALYDSMVHAIAECHRVDEVKDIRDKAAALEAYARQAKNVEAERKACEIRLRAERKAGDLLASMQKATNRDAGKVSGAVRSNESHRVTRSEYAQALQTSGLSKQTAHRYRQRYWRRR